MRDLRTLLYSGAAVAIAQGAFLAPAQAQIEEILVEARKRTESLQDVPLAVTAFNQRNIQVAYSNTVDELDRFIPNVEFSDIQFSGQTLGASIRGLGFADLEKTFEPAVGVSIDGVFLASNTGGAFDLFDLESIEVLRGPQGTLFGRNTVGGVIQARRTRPTGELGIKAGVRYARHADREYRFIGNLPQIGDQLSTKVYFFRDASKTYAKNIATGEKEDFTDNISGGISLLWEPTSNLDIQFTFDIFDDDSSAQPIYNLTEAVNGEGQNFFFPPPNGGGNFCDLTRDAATLGLLPADQANNGCRSASLGLAEDTDFEFFVRDFPFQNNIEGIAITNEVNWDLDNGWTLTSITGYRDTDEQLTEENMGAPNIQGDLTLGASIPIFVANRFQNFSQFSQEFRAAGDVTEDFTLVAGVYYLNTDYDISGGPNPVIPGLPNATAIVLGGSTNDFTAAQKLNAIAVFADGTYEFNDKFSFSGGIRYTRENKDFEIDFITTNGAPGVGLVNDDNIDGFFPPDADVGRLDETFTALTGRGIFQYQFTDDIMGFAGWSRGYRSGGYNGRGTTPTSLGPYDEEIVDNFEGGFRAEFFDNRLRFNPTVFYTKYRDSQQEIIRASPADATVTETIVENAADLTIWGIEIEGVAQITEDFNIRFSGGYLNSDFDNFLVPEDPADTSSPLIDVSDTRAVRRAPEFSFSVAGDYSRQISDDFLMRFSAAYSWQDDFAASPVIDTTGADRHIIVADGAADFSITLESTFDDRANYQITAFINDAFHGERARLTNSLDAGVFWFGNGSPTTIWGIEATFDFQ
ncbi:MAG: TonB-dependent receptor [Sphingomonadales bacterium]